jgi:hypothetical protein
VWKFEHALVEKRYAELFYVWGVDSSDSNEVFQVPTVEAHRGRVSESRSAGSTSGRPRRPVPLSLSRCLPRRPRPPQVCRYQCTPGPYCPLPLISIHVILKCLIQSRVYGTDPSVKRTLRCQYYSTMPMALHYGSKRRGSLSRPALFIKFQVSCGNNIRLWPGCRRQEEIKCSWMRPQMSQMVIRAHLAWLRGGLVIISRCDICQWVQGLAASPYPQPCMLNQHNIYAQIVHCTRAINRTCQVEA